MARVGRPRKRRARTAHSGVKLKYIKRTDSWVARYVDPDTGRETQKSMEKLGKTTDEARREWAISMAENIKARRAELAAGKARRTETTLRKAVDDFYASKAAQIKPSSMASLRYALEPLVGWAARRGVAFVESLTPALLKDFYTDYISRPAYGSAKGAKRNRKAEEHRRKAGAAPKAKLRGQKVATNRSRSKRTINKALILIRSFLNDARATGHTPHLSADDVNSRRHGVVKLLKQTGKERINFLRPAQVQALLDACVRHDGDTWKLTRQEHGGKGTPGSTAKHAPIAAFTLTCLLSGMRFSEAAGLRWAEVDLDAQEVALPSDRVKTAEARQIDLAITPGLARLLAAMKLRANGSPFVFGRSDPDKEGAWLPMTRDLADSTRRRLTREYEAPEFSWHDLRRTCGTALTCAPSIFGAASAFLSAKRLGHSVVIAEKYYVGQMKNLPAEARTLEDALGIGAQVEKIIAADKTKATERPKLRATA